MSGYEIKVSITPLCPSCGKVSHSGGFVAESRESNGAFDRDNPYGRTDRRVFISPCPECFVFRGDVAELLVALEPAISDEGMDQPELDRLRAALARVKGGAA